MINVGNRNCFTAGEGVSRGTTESWRKSWRHFHPDGHQLWREGYQVEKQTYFTELTMEQIAQARVCAGLHQGPEACRPPFPPISNIDLPPNKKSSNALKHLEMTDAQGGVRKRETAHQVWIISRNKLCFIDYALSFRTIGHRYCLTSDHMIQTRYNLKCWTQTVVNFITRLNHVPCICFGNLLLRFLDELWKLFLPPRTRFLRSRKLRNCGFTFAQLFAPNIFPLIKILFISELMKQKRLLT